MSVVTAQIIAGTGDLYRPGVRPLNVLWFAEGGGRPSWLLERSGWLDFIEPGLDDPVLDREELVSGLLDNRPPSRHRDPRPDGAPCDPHAHVILGPAVSRSKGR